jgi:hypothetical protein
MTGMLIEPGALKILVEARVAEVRSTRIGKTIRGRLPRPN